MLARRVSPTAYAEWNRRQRAPFGRPGSHRIRRLVPRSRLVAHYVGQYGWQANSTLRAVEYPWAYYQIANLNARQLRILDIGASLAGLQFTLAQEGHQVHAVDPGMKAKGLGWEVNPEQHQFLARVYRAPVALHPVTLAEAAFPDRFADVIVSVSTIEHFTDDDLNEFARETRRVLKPGGHLVLTVDLFLDVRPFTVQERNEWGFNIDVKRLIDDCACTIVVGDPSELHGFPDFDPHVVQNNLPSYAIGDYPALAQCLVAQRNS